MKLNLDFSLYKGTTRLRHWWKAVKANFEAVQNAHNDLEDTHAKDMETLKNADADIKQRIENEASARSAADNALGERITTEANARTDADTALGQRITAEASSRSAADTELGGRIDNETNARTDADNALGQRINAEASARSAADSTLSGRIDNEITAREDADTALSDRINTEAAAREKTDNALDGRLKKVEKMAHEHVNKGILDGIDADRVRKWDDGSEGAITLGEWLEHLAEAERQFDMLWDLFGMTVYDGGWFGMAQIDAPLDGGDFDDTTLTPVDCGDFGKFVPSGGGSMGDVVDGGVY